VLIPPYVKTVLRPAARLVRWFRREHMHVVAAARDGKSAFGMMGTSRWRPYFGRVWFGDRERFRTRYRLHGASWVKQAHALAARHGLVVVSETPVPAEIADALLTVPTWVALAVDLRDSEAEFRSSLSRSARHDLQKIRAAKFAFTVNRDPAWAEEYHDRYHKPSIVGRHGEEGFVMSAQGIATMVRDRGGEFVCVWQGERCIGAMLNEVVGNQYALRRIGWLNGDPALAKTGAIAALYWHSMQRARLLGYRRIQMGGTPSCIEDGVFQFKNKWNAGLDVAESVWGNNFLLLSPAHPDVKRVLSERSFIVRNARDEFVVISGKDPDDVTMSVATARSITRWYRLGDAPSVESERENDDLPPALRAWFRAVPIAKAR
jgi:hypothetical protein